MKVAICTPVHGDPKTAYVRSLANMLVHTAEHRPDLILRPIIGQGHLLGVRNSLAEHALEMGVDYVLWIDADIQFPSHSLITLLDHGLEVVGCNYATRAHPPRTTAFIATDASKFAGVFTTEEIANRTPLEEVSHMGLGFCLVAGPALAALDRPTFMTKPGHGSQLGEDELLFERLRANGLKILVDHRLSLEIAHVGDFAFTNQVAAHFAHAGGA